MASKYTISEPFTIPGTQVSGFVSSLSSKEFETFEGLSAEEKTAATAGFVRAHFFKDARLTEPEFASDAEVWELTPHQLQSIAEKAIGLSVDTGGVETDAEFRDAQRNGEDAEVPAASAGADVREAPE